MKLVPQLPGPDRRLVLVKYSETPDPDHVADIPQHGLFVCEVAELVFAHNAGPVLIAETVSEGSLYGEVRLDDHYEAPTCEIMTMTELDAEQAWVNASNAWIAIFQEEPVGFDIVAALRNDSDGQRWTLQAGLQRQLLEYKPGQDEPFQLTRETYDYVCAKWGWNS